MSEYEVGQEFRIAYPFIKDTYYVPDEDGGSELPTWRPGCRYEACGYYGDDSEAVADGQGEQILTVVDVHKPGKYPVRVFYTIGWVTPDGKKFGKGKLHIATVEKFRRRTRGFMSHENMFEYRLASESEAA
jgi:hypothetical protein